MTQNIKKYSKQCKNDRSNGVRDALAAPIPLRLYPLMAVCSVPRGSCGWYFRSGHCACCGWNYWGACDACDRCKDISLFLSNVVGIPASLTPLSYSFLLVSLHLATVAIATLVLFCQSRLSLVHLYLILVMCQWNAGKKAATRRPSAASRSHAVRPPQQNKSPCGHWTNDTTWLSKNDLALGVGCDKHDIILIHPVIDVAHAI